MVFHQVLINKYKVNLGTEVKNKQERGIYYVPNFRIATPAKAHPCMAYAAVILFINRPLK